MEISTKILIAANIITVLFIYNNGQKIVGLFLRKQDYAFGKLRRVPMLDKSKHANYRRRRETGHLISLNRTVEI